jgi:hypothetical protein
MSPDMNEALETIIERGGEKGRLFVAALAEALKAFAEGDTFTGSYSLTMAVGHATSACAHAAETGEMRTDDDRIG